MMFMIICFLFFVREISAKSYNLPKPIDLSFSLDENTANWDKNFTFRLIDEYIREFPDGSFYVKNNFIGAEHGGTHLDAPFHFNKNGWKVSDIPIDNLISTGIILDVSDKVNNSDFELLPEHLEEWQQINGVISKNTIVLINFGWSSKYHNRTEYFGNDQPPYSFPGISSAAAEWIVDKKNIIGVGVGTPSTDFGKSTSFLTHKILAKNNVYSIENVAFPSVTLPTKGFDLIVLPLKIKDGSGGPCRVVAV